MEVEQVDLNSRIESLQSDMFARNVRYLRAHHPSICTATRGCLKPSHAASLSFQLLPWLAAHIGIVGLPIVLVFLVYNFRHTSLGVFSVLTPSFLLCFFGMSGVSLLCLGLGPGSGLQAAHPELGLGPGEFGARARPGRAQARASRPSRARDITISMRVPFLIAERMGL
ncbi:hypothetical protein FB451DRAFT_1171452 [Mycena latifolia]|nr:hypothetical protein FB451DRAFT_1171452 [Mycena latifolia]